MKTSNPLFSLKSIHTHACLHFDSVGCRPEGTHMILEERKIIESGHGIVCPLRLSLALPHKSWTRRELGVLQADAFSEYTHTKKFRFDSDNANVVSSGGVFKVVPSEFLPNSHTGQLPPASHKPESAPPWEVFPASNSQQGRHASPCALLRHPATLLTSAPCHHITFLKLARRRRTI